MRVASAITGLVLVLAILALGWPTLYRYDRYTNGGDTTTIRTNRFTGSVQVLTARGWLARSITLAAPALPVALSAEELRQIQSSTKCGVNASGMLQVRLYNGGNKRMASDIVVHLVAMDQKGKHILDRQYTAHCPFGVDALSEGMYTCEAELATTPASSMTFEIVAAHWM